MEEEKTTQWLNEKGQKDKQRSTKHTHTTTDRVTRILLKARAKGQSFYFCYKAYIPRVLLINVFKQTHPSDSLL